MKLKVFLIVLMLIFGWTLQGSDIKKPKQLSIDRIFASDEFKEDHFDSVKILKDGGGYTALENSEKIKGGQNIVKYDPCRGLKEILVSAKAFIPKGQKDPLEVEDYFWSKDDDKLLIFTNSKRVWRRNTKGDYWVLFMKTRQLNKIGGKALKSSLMFAKFCPKGQRVAYVRENNIYLEDLYTREIKQLTYDGSKTLINGTFDWVYEEEFDLRDGFRWSPDGKKIAFWQLDSKGVKDFYLINNTDELYPKIIAVQYPKAGQTNSACRIGAIDVKTKKVAWMKVNKDPRNNYIAYMEWAANSDEIVFQYLNRLQNINRVMLGNAQDGEVKTIITERDSAWLDVVQDLKWTKNGEYFTWLSERDGWRHLYLVSRDGKDFKKITKGDYDIIRILNINLAQGEVYYSASPHNPKYRFLYRSFINKGEKPKKITQQSRGVHSYQISPNGKWAIHSGSTFDTPKTTKLISLPKHKTIKTLVENSKLKKALSKLNISPVEFFRIDIGKGVKLDGWCIKPGDFDPKKNYPVLFYVYGEPWGQTVIDRWSKKQYLWYQMLASEEYIIMSIDNRGTPAPRGRAWRKVVYGKIGVIASLDQAAGVKKILKTRPYIDPDRIGIWGWSGGGSMTLNMLFRYPELYSVGISVAPVSDQRLYDTIYQERYMGLPKDNPDGYKEGSPITYAKNLEGKLLIVHGTGDDNVHYQSTELLINELIKHNKQFTMMAYPNRSHGIYEGENTTRHLYTLLTNFIKDNL